MRRIWPFILLAVLLGSAFLMRASSTPTSRPVADHEDPILPRILKPLDMPVPETTPPRKRDPVPPADATVVEEEEEDSVDVCLASLRWMLNRQNSDGTWGGDPTTLEGTLLSRPGMTGLALVSFLGAGYSHLSKDTYDGLCMGDAVRNSIKWFIADQREDGTFRSSRGQLDHALAALALSEAYGLTGSNLFKAEAQKAIDALVRMQSPDGSWGTGTATAWASSALQSAEISGLKYPRSAPDGVRRYYDVRFAPDPPEMLARMGFDRRKDHPAVVTTAKRIAASPPTSQWPSLHALYFQGAALFQYDGPSGRTWKMLAAGRNCTSVAGGQCTSGGLETNGCARRQEQCRGGS